MSDNARAYTLPERAPDAVIWKAHQALHNQWSTSKVADGNGCGDCHADLEAIFDVVWDDIRALATKGSQP